MTDEPTTHKPPFSEEKTCHWLSWLARAMQRNGETEFLFERMQPTWLEHKRSQFIYVMVSRLIQGLVIGLMFTAMEVAMLASQPAAKPANAGTMQSQPKADAATPRSLVNNAAETPVSADQSLRPITATAATTNVDLTDPMTTAASLDSNPVAPPLPNLTPVIKMVPYHISWALIAGLALGILDYYRLSNNGKWKWINKPQITPDLVKRLLGFAETCMRPLSFIPAVSKLQKEMPTKPEWAKIQIEKLLQHVMAWSVVWVVVGSVLSVTALPIILWQGGGWTKVALLGLFVIIVGCVSSRAIGRTWNNDIECVETLGESWGQASVGAIAGAIGGGVVWLAFFDFSDFMGQGIVLLVVGAIVGSAFHGLVVSVRELNVRPNQGIELSLKHSLQYGSFIGLLCGTIWGYQIWDSHGFNFADIWFPLMACGLAGLIIGLVIRSTTRLKPMIKTRDAALGGAMLGWVAASLALMSMADDVVLAGTISGIICIGIVAAIWFGGLELIRHFTLRGILWIRGDAPLIFVPFFNYAADRVMFLQHVGGGYMFIHRYLMEHFAAYQKTSDQLAVDKTPGL